MVNLSLLGWLKLEPVILNRVGLTQLAGKSLHAVVSAAKPVDVHQVPIDRRVISSQLKLLLNELTVWLAG